MDEPYNFGMVENIAKNNNGTETFLCRLNENVEGESNNINTIYDNFS